MKSETLFQVSTLTDFQKKGYDGQISIETMLAYGDTGFGTYHELNGEMIVLDGVAYRARGDCSVEVANLSETTPFATLGFLKKDEEQFLAVNGDLRALMKNLNILTGISQKPILARLTSVFDIIELHGVWPQKKPYEELDKIVSDQSILVMEKIRGVLVGIYCPESAQGMNVVGWHFHFLSADKKIGGHVNDLSVGDLVVEFEIKESLSII
ncbi:MAG: acetolactate decarboxylase [Acetobacterium woodii]|nr:acetolactate decarboxylase [Acetobacterium woodii]